MHIVRYSATRLAFGLLAGLAMLLCSFAMIGAERGKTQFAGALFLIIGPLLAVGCMKMLMGNREALRFDASSVEITTMWRRQRFAWSQVEAVLLKTVNSYALYGLIKTGSSQSLNIKTAGGLFGTRSHTISKVFLEINDHDYAALPALMERLRRGHQPVQTAAPLNTVGHAPVHQQAALHAPIADSGDFNPDAALARYMQRKAASPSEPSGQTAAPTLNGLPMQTGSHPVRPAFGRKGIPA